MYTLIFSISCSVAVSVLLKVARSRKIEVDQAIAFNYVMAGSLCWLLLNPQPGTLLQSSAGWPLLLALGLLLPSVFLIMAKAVQEAGIVLSDVAQRLSLLIPLIAAFTVFGEDASSNKLIGIGLALCALAALLWRPTRRDDGLQPIADAPAETGTIMDAQPAPGTSSAAVHPSRASAGRTGGLLVVGLLLGVWVGYGTIDILFKQMAKTGSAFPTTLLGAFAMAGLVSFVYLFARRSQWTLRSMLAGLFLGLLNFGNIYFYVRAHQVYSENPTLVFSAMNIGVISLGTLIGAGVFRERVHWVNGVGIALAILAIVILFPR